MGYALGFEAPLEGVGGPVTTDIDKYAELVPPGGYGSANSDTFDI
jgi:hypothetical protein